MEKTRRCVDDVTPVLSNHSTPRDSSHVVARCTGMVYFGPAVSPGIYIKKNV